MARKDSCIPYSPPRTAKPCSRTDTRLEIRGSEAEPNEKGSVRSDISFFGDRGKLCTLLPRRRRQDGGWFSLLVYIIIMVAPSSRLIGLDQAHM